MRGVGSLTIKLEFEVPRIRSVRLCIPALAIDQHLTRFAKFENLPAGNYDGTLMSYLNTGEEKKQTIKVSILPNQENVHQFDLAGMFQDFLLRPLDAEGRTMVSVEMKIENVDTNFRPVRDWKGLSFRLKPGDYRVKILFPDMRVKTLPLHVTGGVQNYTLQVEEKLEGTRRERRFSFTVPVDYRTEEGFWVSTQTINISPTGICLVKRPWKIEKSDITVRIFVPIEISPLECPARVRWSKDEGTGLPQMGVELFLTSTVKNSLSSWLSRRQRDAGN